MEPTTSSASQLVVEPDAAKQKEQNDSTCNSSTALCLSVESCHSNTEITLANNGSDSIGIISATGPPPSTISRVICCGCFGFIQVTETTIESDENVKDAFCQACLLSRNKKKRASHASPPNTEGSHLSSVTVSGGEQEETVTNDPIVGALLPKFSLLAREEAKYKDKMEFLKLQQQMLQQKQEELVQLKKLQQEKKILQKKQAIQRAKEFQKLQKEKNQLEKNKFSFYLQENTARNEEKEIQNNSEPFDEAGALKRISPPMTSARGTTEKKKLIIKLPKRLKNLTVTGGVSTAASLPSLQPSKCTSRSTPRSSADSDADAEQDTSVVEAKKKLEKAMMAYAQDLTPLVNGARPKQLPVPLQAPKKKLGKKLHPLEAKKKKKSTSSSKSPKKQTNNNSNNNNNNGNGGEHVIYDDQWWKKEDTTTSSQRFNKKKQQELTPEIKHFSWMSQLEKQLNLPETSSSIQKDVNPPRNRRNSVLEKIEEHEVVTREENHNSSSSVSSPTTNGFQDSTASPFSHSYTSAATPSYSTPSYFSTTMASSSLNSTTSGGGSSLLLSYPSISSPTSMMSPIYSGAYSGPTNSTCNSSSSSSSSLYTSDRLTSLLQKYNVNVNVNIQST
jgi:hypothetical protein